MISQGMDQTSLIVLQAASHVLSQKHPSSDQIKILTDYAGANLPPKAADLPADELATIVALQLKGIDVAKALD